MRVSKALLLAIPIALLAQVETTTSIRGLVTDQSGAAVQGVAIATHHIETNEERSTVTDATGFYAFPSLLRGTYNIAASHSGFKKAAVAGRVTEVCQAAQVDFILQLGETNQSVTVTGGWTLSGIVQMSTGIPNFVTTTDNSGTGYGIMPERVCNASAAPGGRSRTEWFNSACFVQPAFGTFGNSNFGVYTDPGLNNWNVGVSKNIRLGMPIEGNHLQFRSEFFNVWNHTQWGPAVAMTTVASSTAGQISSTRPPRQIQLSLHYIF